MALLPRFRLEDTFGAIHQSFAKVSEAAELETSLYRLECAIAVIVITLTV